MCTNRADTLDPALLRPGRLDRKIEFPQPGRREKRLIFQVLTASMNLSEEVDLEDYVSRPEKISGAEIACIVQEAGMQAVRNNRYVVLPKDFEKGYKANTQKNDKVSRDRRPRPRHACLTLLTRLDCCCGSQTILTLSRARAQDFDFYR